MVLHQGGFVAHIPSGTVLEEMLEFDSHDVFGVAKTRKRNLPGVQLTVYLDRWRI